MTVSTYLPEYLAAKSPTERSRIIAKVRDLMKEICPVGSFIRVEKGVYYELSDKACREKVSALFRDFMQANGISARGSGKAKRAIKTSQFNSSLSETEEKLGVASRRPSVDDGSSSSCVESIVSVFDVDTMKSASIDGAADLQSGDIEEDDNSIDLDDLRDLFLKDS